MLREQIKKDFGLDLPISGGNANSLNDAMSIHSTDKTEVSWVEMHVLRVVLGIRKWHWRCIAKEIDLSAGHLIEKVVCETKYLSGDTVHIDKRNFYFKLDGLETKQKEIIQLPVIAVRGMGFSVPYQIGWLHYDNLINNEDKYPGMGVTVAYSMPNAKATLYIYDKGEKIIDSVQEPASFQQEFESAINSYMSMNPEMGSPTNHSYPNFLMSVFVENKNYSAICLGTYQNKYVKFRLTSDDCIERFKFECVQDSIGIFFSLFGKN